MKLSDLIAYRTLLRRYRPIEVLNIVDQHLGPLLYTIDNSTLRFTTAENNIHKSHQAARLSLEHFQSHVQDLLNVIDETITSITPAYLTRSYQLYDENMRQDTPELILSRKLCLPSDTQEYLRGRIKLYTDWRRAGMVIRPGEENWVQDMVALDPLYLVDTHKELLGPTIEKFTAEYQRRIRSYVISEEFDQPLLNDLPNEQIGFCLAYNFFNYKPFELVRQYLAEIYNKLQPGGRLFFTINDCDRAGGVDNSERSWMCFTPSSLVSAIVQSLGYEIYQTLELDAAATWYEVIKPGEFQTLRGGQNLARINWKGDTIDTTAKPQYTQQQQQKIFKQAQKLKLDTGLPLPELQKLIKERNSQ